MALQRPRTRTSMKRKTRVGQHVMSSIQDSKNAHTHRCLASPPNMPVDSQICNAISYDLQNIAIVSCEDPVPRR